MKFYRHRFLAIKAYLAVALALSVGTACAQTRLPTGDSVALLDAQLPAAIKQELAKVVISDLEDADGIDVANRRRIALDSRVSFVRLSRSGPLSIYLQPSDEGYRSLCAPNGGGNCPSWLFIRSGNHALLVLEDDGEGIVVKKTSHNGMSDLVTTSRVRHTPITEDAVELHFDGKGYQPASCTESTSGGDAENTVIPPHPCT